MLKYTFKGGNFISLYFYNICSYCLGYFIHLYSICDVLLGVGGGNDFQWCFSQVKGALDEDVAEGKSSFPFQHIDECLFIDLITGVLCMLTLAS
jgi:hypothetical protein